MSLKDSVGKFFSEYIADVNPTTPPPAPQTPPTPTAPIQRISSSVPSDLGKTIDSKGDPQLVEMLHQKIRALRQQQIIQQFFEVTESLGEFIPDEGQRFRAAAKQLQKSDVTVDAILQAYGEMFTFLDEEQKRFISTMADYRENEIKTREQQIETINNQLVAKEAEIKALIDQRDSLAGEIVQKKLRIDTTESHFQGAVVVVRNEIEDAVRKVKLYLPAPTPTPAK